MPADLFISYSSKDRSQAEQLIQLLSSAGFSVWIDHSEIEAATSWSREIVQAIDGCKAFLVLLSNYSNVSSNVVKEVSLAAEKQKKILPVDLEPVGLNEDLQYHLAGLQRTSMTNTDAIIRAIAKIGLETIASPGPTIVRVPDGRKSLMILPFEDLSPTADNGWFADGIVSELIGALSRIKALRLADNQATKEFKNFRGQLATYAKATNFRYFVQGDVRKFGDQIKISTRLVDIETGEYLWQDVMKGTMNDIFDIQEKVAEKVVEGLRIHLLPAEIEKLTKRGTESAEAYEYYLRAYEYFVQNTRTSMEHALDLTRMALEADPDFAEARLRRAVILLVIYSNFARQEEFLTEAEGLLHPVQDRISAESDWRVLGVRARLHCIRSEWREAEALIRENILLQPNDWNRHAELAQMLLESGRHSEAILAYERAFELEPAFRQAMHLITMATVYGDKEQQRHVSELFIPFALERLKIEPTDENAIVWYCMALHNVGRSKEAVHFLRTVPDATMRQPEHLYNIACVGALLGEQERALRWLQRYAALTREGPQEQLDGLMDSDLISLRGTTEFEALLRDVIQRIPIVANG